jgi:MFS family permease
VGIGVIGAASPMLQETFGGALFRDPSIGFTQFSDAQKTLAAEIGGGIIGLFSLFNIGGRFFWATLSDSIGRKTTYFRSSCSACFVTPARRRSRA